MYKKASFIPVFFLVLSLTFVSSIFAQTEETVDPQQVAVEQVETYISTNSYTTEAEAVQFVKGLNELQMSFNDSRWAASETIPAFNVVQSQYPGVPVAEELINSTLRWVTSKPFYKRAVEVIYRDSPTAATFEQYLQTVSDNYLVVKATEVAETKHGIDISASGYISTRYAKALAANKNWEKIISLIQAGFPNLQVYKADAYVRTGDIQSAWDAYRQTSDTSYLLNQEPFYRIMAMHVKDTDTPVFTEAEFCDTASFKGSVKFLTQMYNNAIPPSTFTLLVKSVDDWKNQTPQLVDAFNNMIDWSGMEPQAIIDYCKTIQMLPPPIEEAAPFFSAVRSKIQFIEDYILTTSP